MKKNNHQIPKRDNFFESFYSVIAKKLTPYFFKFTANEVTIISGIFGVIGSIFLIFDNYLSLVVASLFIQIFSILDLIDGNLARASNTQSSFGMWLDIFFDKLVDFLLIFMATFGIYFNNQDPLILIFGIILMGSVFLNQIIMILNNTESYFASSRISESNLVTSKLIKKFRSGYFFTLLYFYRKHLSYQHNTFLFLISFFALINQLRFGIYFITIHSVISLMISIMINFIRIKKN